MSDGGEWRLGFQAVREVLRSRPHLVAELIVARSAGERRRTIERLSTRRQVRVTALPPGEFRERLLRDGLDPAAARGFVARIRVGLRGEVGLRAGDSSSDPEFVVLVEDVQDPRNLGAMLRVCEGAGVGRVLIRDRGSAPLSSTVASASAGAVDWMALERITNSGIEIGRLKRAGYWVYGADAKGQPPWTVDLSGPVVFCIGGEARGLRKRTKGLCDALVGLPMRGRVESLNLATAAAGLLYEAVRQRLVIAGPLA